MMFSKSPRMPEPQEALPGRQQPMALNPELHYVNRHSMLSPWPQGHQQALFGMGCFWGAERMFWQLPGVWVTAVGYAGGYTPNPTYAEVCTGRTGHNEVVRVVFDPESIDYQTLLQTFWQGHDPTQSMRQGNDIGTQYRSGIYTSDGAHQAVAEQSRAAYQAVLAQAGLGQICTEILAAPEFYYAESEHQQYLAKNPGGYCGLGGTGVSYPDQQKP